MVYTGLVLLFFYPQSNAIKCPHFFFRTIAQLCLQIQYTKSFSVSVHLNLHFTHRYLNLSKVCWEYLIDSLRIETIKPWLQVEGAERKYIKIQKDSGNHVKSFLCVHATSLVSSLVIYLSYDIKCYSLVHPLSQKHEVETFSNLSRCLSWWFREWSAWPKTRSRNAQVINACLWNRSLRSSKEVMYMHLFFGWSKYIYEIEVLSFAAFFIKHSS